MIDLLGNKNFLIGAVLIVVFYFMLKYGSKKDKNFEKEYHDIVHSNKYKAKGQFD
mgnify:CR=1 FL=1